MWLDVVLQALVVNDRAQSAGMPVSMQVRMDSTEQTRAGHGAASQSGSVCGSMGAADLGCRWLRTGTRPSPGPSQHPRGAGDPHPAGPAACSVDTKQAASILPRSGWHFDGTRAGGALPCARHSRPISKHGPALLGWQQLGRLMGPHPADASTCRFGSAGGPVGTADDTCARGRQPQSSCLKGDRLPGTTAAGHAARLAEGAAVHCCS